MDINFKISNKQENIDFYFINSIYDTIKGRRSIAFFHYVLYFK